MTRHPPRLLVVPVLAVITVGAASSCGTPRTGSGGSQRAAVQQRAIAVPATLGQSIAQVGHGRQAYFSSCAPSACPVVTPKTLAVDPPHAAAPEPRADASPGPNAGTARSLIQGETLKIAAALAPAAPDPWPTVRPKAMTEPVLTEVVATFPFGSAVLPAAARAAIDVAATADVIQRIDIRSRTDNVGRAAANEELARQRAEAVVQYLLARHPQLASAKVNVDARGN